MGDADLQDQHRHEGEPHDAIGEDWSVLVVAGVAVVGFRLDGGVVGG